MTQDRGFRAIAFSILSNGLATSAKVQSSDVGAQARQAALAARTPPCRARPSPWPSGRHDHRLALDLRQAVFAGALACNLIRVGMLFSALLLMRESLALAAPNAMKPTPCRRAFSE